MWNRKKPLNLNHAPSTNNVLVSYKTYPMFTESNALRYKLENFGPLLVNSAHQKDVKKLKKHLKYEIVLFFLAVSEYIILTKY